jgi:Flp pilus assembly protein TadB
MSPALLALLATVAVLVGLTSSAPPGSRDRDRRAARRAGPMPASPPTGARRFAPAVVAVLAGVATAVVVGGPGGAVTGVVVTAAVLGVLARLEPGAQRRHREALERQAPLVVDLVAACLASGAPLERALAVASVAVGPPTSEVLVRAITALQLGAEPSAVWAEVARDDALAPLARAVARSQQTGAPLSSLLPRVADQARALHRVRAETRIRTAAVRLTAPLGAAFLPAFVLLGVVPVVVSWVGTLL